MLQGLLGSVRAVAVQPVLGFQLGTNCLAALQGFGVDCPTKGIACLVVPIKS
jgi:hypothetical protein